MDEKWKNHPTSVLNNVLNWLSREIVILDYLVKLGLIVEKGIV